MFSANECVFMVANCIASSLSYAGLLMFDSSALSAVCIEYEDITLIVLIVRIYVLPVVCIFKMGIDTCRSHGDMVDMASLVFFVYLQVYYCLMPAYSQRECHEYFLTHTSWPSLLALVIAITIDSTRATYYLIMACCFRKRRVRLEEESQEHNETSDKAALLPTSKSDIDELLEELDSMD
jgi:ABC-type branched-subunit amino acid transport system permease subunit